MEMLVVTYVVIEINGDVCEGSKRPEKVSYLTLYVTFAVFLGKLCNFCMYFLKSAYAKTGFLRTAYQPFAYSVKSKNLTTAYSKGGSPSHKNTHVELVQFVFNIMI